MPENRQSLVDAIANLREQLTEARERQIADAAKSPNKATMVLQLDSAEIELKVAASSEGGVGGKVNYWVYSVEASGKLSNEVVHTVKIKLTPKGPDGKPVNLSASVPGPK